MASAINDAARPDVAEIKRRIERLCSDPGHAFCDNWGHEDVVPLVAEIERLRAALRQILEDPDALILDSHRDDGHAALGDTNGA